RMQRIGSLVCLGRVHQPAELFRPQTAMHEPLLEPHCLQRTRGDFGEQRLDVRRAEGPESGLCARGVVRITRVEGSIVIDKPNTSVQVSLIQDVAVYVSRQIPAVAGVTRCGIDTLRQRWRLAIL